LGQLAGQQGRADEAMGHYREAIRLNPDHAASHESLGLALAGAGQTQAAIRHLRAAVRLDPTRQRAREQLTRLAAGPG
jgi:tetratricopeptide (TPR) repeat protein